MWMCGREGRYRSGGGGGGEEEVEMVDGEKVKGEVQEGEEVEEVEEDLVEEEMETEMRRRIRRSPNERESEGKGRVEPEVKNACLRL